jgi:hypothetical protein
MADSRWQTGRTIRHQRYAISQISALSVFLLSHLSTGETLMLTVVMLFGLVAAAALLAQTIRVVRYARTRWPVDQRLRDYVARE